QAGGLLLGALREIGGAAGNLRRRAGDLAGRGCDRSDRLLQLRDRGVEVIPDLPILHGEAIAEAERQVALRELAERCAERAEGLRLFFGRLGPFLRGLRLNCRLALLAPPDPVG